MTTPRASYCFNPIFDVRYCIIASFRVNILPLYLLTHSRYDTSTRMIYAGDSELFRKGLHSKNELTELTFEGSFSKYIELTLPSAYSTPILVTPTIIRVLLILNDPNMHFYEIKQLNTHVCQT